jgi:uncharacterized damage-inducible protein DinB
MKGHFCMFAHYNAWANERVFRAAAALSEADYRADRGAYFKSIHGTLNHLLVGDQIWHSRFVGETPTHARLDAIPFERLSDLRDAREAEDRWICEFTAALDNARLAAMIRYQRGSTGETYSQSLASALAHFFNHQTHHRGQVHAMLTALVGSAPELDLIHFQRTPGAARS